MADPFQDSRQHLWDELARVDLLVKAQTARWRTTIGATKPPHLWGMVHVTEAEVEAYLSDPLHPPAGDEDAAEYRRAADALPARIEQRREATPDDVTLRFDRLAGLFGLSELERDILLVALLPEVDGRYHRLFGYLQDDASRTRPSVELVAGIVQRDPADPGPARAAFHRAAPLLRHHLLSPAVLPARPGELDTEPLWARPVQIDDRAAAYLLGSDHYDGRLAGIMSQPDAEVTVDDLVLDTSDADRLRGLADWVMHRIGSERSGTLLFLHGSAGVGRRSAAQAICAACRAAVLFADARACLRTPAGFELLVDLCFREAALHGTALCWTGCETLLNEEQPPDRWEYLAGQAEAVGVLTFAVSDLPWDPVSVPGPGRERGFGDGGFQRLDVPMPDYRLRVRLWERYFPDPGELANPGLDRAGTARVLANAFRLSGGQIIAAVAAAQRQARTREPRNPQITVDDLHTGCRRQTSTRLVSFGRRIEAGTDLGFSDLILPASSHLQLAELRAHIANRSRVLTELGFERRLPLGRGLIAMFTGTSGTGKTMTAELLARDQGVDLFKIDLSAVVSKYVGETEKNLSRVFADAEHANAIIFFDEADALFGKRGEVKDARDRWANIEVNYLLQRVEEYAGVVILASNLQQNIDEAFLRRIQCIVDFPFPDAEARLHIWKGVFPPDLPGPSEDELRELAGQFKLAGGNIRNIVVDAAFRALAAAQDGPLAIRLRDLVVSTAREYQKLGKPITRGEFSPHFYSWLDDLQIGSRTAGARGG
jgi:hypothetical protein